MYMLRFDSLRCVFVVLCVDETHYFMREYSDAIKLPKSYPPPPWWAGITD